MPTLRDEILQEHSKAQTMHIVHRIGDDRAAFDELMQCMLHDDKLVAQRALGSSATASKRTQNGR